MARGNAPQRRQPGSGRQRLGAPHRSAHGELRELAPRRLSLAWSMAVVVKNRVTPKWVALVNLVNRNIDDSTCGFLVFLLFLLTHTQIGELHPALGTRGSLTNAGFVLLAWRQAQHRLVFQ